jgi:6-phosphogluconolactonase (cycloisomerase 2 family)
MSTRFTCLLATVLLLSIGFLLACGTNYHSNTDGLIVVPSLGSAVVQSFSFDLNNGHIAELNNGDGPVLPGPPQQSGPSQIVMDPAGAFAYVAESVGVSCAGGPGGIQGAIVTYKVKSDGTLSTNGDPMNVGPCPGNTLVGLTIDSAGKFLFVASQLTATTDGTPISGNVHVFAIGSGAALTEVPGSPFAVPVPSGGMTPNPSALAVSHTAFPVTNAPCTNGAAPSNEYVYVTDLNNNDVLEFSVDPSSGTLTAQPPSVAIPGFPAGTNPSGVVVDPCDRFLYVANQLSNNVSAYIICNGIPPSSSACSTPNWSLIPAPGSPFVAGDGPGPLAVDPTASFVYVVDVTGSQISGYRISGANGALQALSPPTVPTNSMPEAIVIRGDDSWVFVANSASANVSQYLLTPSTGALTPQSPVETDNFPWSVAVK